MDAKAASMDWRRELAVLMAVRVHGRADAARVARTAGLAETDAAADLAALLAEGLVAAVPPPAAAVTLTERGRDVLAHRVSIEARDVGEIADDHDAFLAVDRALKETITAWQLAGDVEKAAAREALTKIGSKAYAVATVLAEHAPRFQPYASRIGSATVAMLRDARYVASPLVDSLHQIWFELHEDLLATLGRSRAS